MKLASLKDGGRDGALVVVDRALARCVSAAPVAATLQEALETWDETAPKLADIARTLEAGERGDAMLFDAQACAAPLPRSHLFADGSAYVHHMKLLRQARGAGMPDSFWTEPLMYQGLSGGFLGPRDGIALQDETWGLDLEGELAVVLDDVPQGIAAEAAGAHIKLVMLLNDISLRALIPDEMRKGFGFFHSKPASSFAPVAVTPGGLGAAWDGGRLHLPLHCGVNGETIGRPKAGEGMVFDFGRLIAHAARTRSLPAGSIIGSGTVSNDDPDVGSACLAEVRAIETLDHGEARTPYLRYGDVVRIEVLDENGMTVFGRIEQKIIRFP